MKCKECNYYQEYYAGDGHGECAIATELLGEQYISTNAESNCFYQVTADITCADCFNFFDDYGCMEREPNDTFASQCKGFCFLAKQQILHSLAVLLTRGAYNREFIMDICDKFEASDLFKAISEHRGMDHDE